MSAQTPAMNGGPCRSCGALLELPVTDLGMSPPCESYLTAEQLHDMEEFFRENARVAIVAGSACGEVGDTAIRFNFAMSRALVEQAITQMGEAMRTL